MSLQRIVRWAQITAVAIVTVSLVFTIGFLFLEESWVEPQFREPEEAFFYGTIGTELVPLPVLKVLPDLFPEHFQPAGPEAGDWVEQFGFLRSDDPRSRGLPVGFVVSNYRPQSGAPSPVEFVGFGCALCHTTEIRGEGSDETHFVVGTGNATLNLFAWIDAFKAAILDEERLTVNTIAETHEARYGEKVSTLDKLFIRLWLRQIRGLIQEGLPRFDEPYGLALSLTPDAVPTGPGRTQPFRTIIRRFLDRPGTTVAVYTKIAPIYQQRLKTWAQVDGSVDDLSVRSSQAALAAGATVDNLAVPEITHNVRSASQHTIDLQGRVTRSCSRRKRGPSTRNVSLAVSRSIWSIVTCVTATRTPTPGNGYLESVRGRLCHTRKSAPIRSGSRSAIMSASPMSCTSCSEKIILSTSAEKCYVQALWGQPAATSMAPWTLPSLAPRTCTTPAS